MQHSVHHPSFYLRRLDLPGSRVLHSYLTWQTLLSTLCADRAQAGGMNAAAFIVGRAGAATLSCPRHNVTFATLWRVVTHRPA